MRGRGQGLLPGMPSCASVSPEKRLRLWLAEHDMTLADLARRLGVHHTYPGKVLVARSEEPSPEFRARLLKLGMPEDLVPQAAERRRGRPPRGQGGL